MRNTWIRRISAIRKDGVESAINLTCGLNCVIGASNLSLIHIFVIVNLGELVIDPTVRDGEAEIARESRRHVGHKRVTRASRTDDAGTNIAGRVNPYSVSTTKRRTNRTEVWQDIAGHLVIGRIEVYSEVDMGGRDAKTLRRLTSGLGMSSAVCRGEMLQLRGVLLEDREEPHAAPSDALELTRTDGPVSYTHLSRSSKCLTTPSDSCEST